MFLRLSLLFVAALAMSLASAQADCVDINADPPERLTAIAHINGERAVQLISGRPWPSVRSLTGINGIGCGRIRNIPKQDLVCVGVRAPRGGSEAIEGVDTVLDADTFQVAGGTGAVDRNDYLVHHCRCRVKRLIPLCLRTPSRVERAGIWRGTFVEPWVWRRRQ